MSYIDSLAGSAATASEQEVILRTLRAVLESPHFCKSKRYPALLEFAVRSALEPTSETVKERTVGVKVFGRPTDYDTSNDSVVRIAAGEVRKRLALYFGEHPEAPVRIDLPTGSYKAEFHFQPAFEQENTLKRWGEEPLGTLQGSGIGSIPVIVREPVSSQFNSPSSARWGIWGVLVSSGLLLLAVAVGLWRHTHARVPGDFWSPVLQVNEPGQILVGQTGPPAASSSIAASEAPAGAAESPKLAMDDAIVTGHICSIFREYGRDCSIAQAQLVRLADIRNKSIISIGGFNNPWTQQLLAPLPYKLQFDSRKQHLLVVEESGKGDLPLGSIGAGSPEYSTDYAVIGRFYSNLTDGMAVVVAGLGLAGTNGAGQYVCSPEKMQAILSAAPKGWKGVNFEAVLKVDVLQGSAGHIDVVAARFW